LGARCTVEALLRGKGGFAKIIRMFPILETELGVSFVDKCCLSALISVDSEKAPMSSFSSRNRIGNLRPYFAAAVFARLRRAVVWTGFLATVGGLFTACHMSHKDDNARIAVTRLQAEVVNALREANPKRFDAKTSSIEKQGGLSRAYQGLDALNVSDCPEDVQLEYKKFLSAFHKFMDFAYEMPNPQGGSLDTLQDSRNKEKVAALGNELQQEIERLRSVANKYTTKQ
jgi:hypothetical protein